jgi:nucleotide-binding universal stress UspA family protein
MKKILIPTDFSEPAKWAVSAAKDIAMRSGAEIILLHVVEQQRKDSFKAQGQIEMIEDWEERIFTSKLIQRGKDQLAEIANDLADAHVNVRVELRIGNPYHGISTIITDYEVDLVVMGSCSRSNLERWFVGSNTEKVVRNAKCPVLTIHEKPDNKPFKNIVYATSLMEDENAFSDVIKTAQKIYDATIHVVRINTRSNFRPDLAIKMLMSRFVQRIKLDNYTLNIFNDLTEEEGILHFAKSIDADLIGMARHGRMNLMQWFTGSVLHDVVSHSKKPVLTFVANGRREMLYSQLTNNEGLK